MTTNPTTTTTPTLTANTLTTAAATASRLHPDETGAQSMEYAALAAGGCGIVGILVALWESDTVQDRISELITGLLDTVGSGITDLLPF